MLIKKAVIPIAGLGTRFLPLSKVVTKEFWPLVDKPVLQYIVEEALDSGIKEIIFVNRPQKEETLDYFRKFDPRFKELLRLRKRNHLLKDIEKLEKISKKISFSQVIQKKPLGDGHAILQAKKLIGNNPFAVLFGDDVAESEIPCLKQLIEVFKKYKKPVISLCEIPRKRISSYGVVGIEKIEKDIYKIKEIVEKPEAKKAPSNLAIMGKYVLTPDIFDYLQKEKTNDLSKEIILADGLRKMINDNYDILGLNFKGKWLECGNKLVYLKSNLYLSLKHPQFGKELKKYLLK